MDILSTIGFDWHVAVANLVSFLIIFLLLKKFAFGPIKRTIDERKKKISEGLDKAQEAETQIMMANQEKERIVNEAKQEANTIVASSKQRAEEVAQKVRDEAESEKVAIIKEGEKRAQREFDRMQQEIRGQAAELVVAIVQKILVEDLVEKQSKKLSERAVTLMRK